MDPVLLVRQAAHFHSMELERAKAICGFESSSRSRLWGTRGDCAGSQEVAVFGLGLSRDISTAKQASGRSPAVGLDRWVYNPNWLEPTAIQTEFPLRKFFQKRTPEILISEKTPRNSEKLRRNCVYCTLIRLDYRSSSNRIPVTRQKLRVPSKRGFFGLQVQAWSATVVFVANL